jgi:hypothetical protein
VARRARLEVVVPTRQHRIKRLIIRTHPAKGAFRLSV